MKIRVGFWYFLGVLTVAGGSLSAQTTVGSTAKNVSQHAMDRDLLEVTIPQLEELYRSRKYTVTEVVQWYMARIARYNGIYRAVQTLDEKGALAAAARDDAEAKAGGSSFRRGPVWRASVVIMAHTNLKGLIDSRV